ncbi:MAG: DUF4785 family protein [Legionellaceae bacterium]|nr:DUF4785 family protein [Legionellaceae bacterium]
MRRLVILLLLCGHAVVARALVLPEQAIRAYTCQTCPQLSHSSLSTHWPLPRQAWFSQQVRSQESRSWQQGLSGRDLVAGFPLHTLAERAVIRLTPLQGKPRSNWQQALSIVSAQGKKWSVPEAGQSTDASALPLAPELAQNSLLLELAPELAHGSFRLQLAGGETEPDARWQLSVYDRFSDLYLHVETDKAEYQYGDLLTATIYMHDASRRYPLELLEAFVEIPGGRRQALVLEAVKPSVYQGTFRLQEYRLMQGENWNLQVRAHQQREDSIVIRTANTLFSYTVPSAKVKSLHRDSRNLWDIDVAVETAMPSRYAVQAILYGYDAHGQLQAAQLAQSAQWLEKGEGRMTLHFGEEAMAELKAPYHIGAIKLSDLTQLKPVYYHSPLIPVDELL